MLETIISLVVSILFFIQSTWNFVIFSRLKYVIVDYKTDSLVKATFKMSTAMINIGFVLSIMTFITSIIVLIGISYNIIRLYRLKN